MEKAPPIFFKLHLENKAQNDINMISENKTGAL